MIFMGAADMLKGRDQVETFLYYIRASTPEQSLTSSCEFFSQSLNTKDLIIWSRSGLQLHSVHTDWQENVSILIATLISWETDIERVSHAWMRFIQIHNNKAELLRILAHQCANSAKHALLWFTLPDVCRFWTWQDCVRHWLAVW